MCQCFDSAASNPLDSIYKIIRGVFLPKNLPLFFVVACWHLILIDRLNNSTACYKEYLYSIEANNCTFIRESCPLSNYEDRHGDHWTQGVCFRGALWDYRECAGQNVMDVCKLGLRDLPEIKKLKCMIANKFGLDVDINAIWCQYKEIYEWTKNYTLDQPQNGFWFSFMYC